MPDKYVQINIGSSHLTDENWEQFKTDTWAALRTSIRSGHPQIEAHLGTGIWEGWEEHSAHISTVADVDTFALRTKLRALKERYYQDAISLIVGSDIL